MNEVARALPMAQSEQYLLSPIHAGINIGAGFIADGGNLARRRNQVSHYGQAVDNMGIGLNIKGGGAVSNQVAQIGGTTAFFQFVLSVKLLGDCYLVYRLIALVEGKAGFID